MSARTTDVLNAVIRRAGVSSPSSTSSTQRGRSQARLRGLAYLALGGVLLLLYGPALTTNLIGDDWVLLETTSGDLLSALGWHGNYHYTPIPQLVWFVEYKVVGLNPIAFHLVDLFLVWLSACAVLYLAWRLTSKLGVGILSAALFVANGRTYEVPIWSVVGVLQTIGLLAYCAGLLLYIRSHNELLAPHVRRWAYAGFVAIVALGPFVYEQEVTLVAACFLYRLLVLEHGTGFDYARLRKRVTGWMRDFWAPLLVFVCYLVFKAWLSIAGSAQAPGLSESRHTLTAAFTLGLADAFLPGISLGPLQHLDLTLRQLSETPRLGVAFGLGEVALLTVIAIRSAPLVRFLIAWTAILVASMVLGLGLVSSRHFFLITTPTVILWALGIVHLPGLTRKLLARYGHALPATRALLYLPAVLIIAVYIVCGLQFALLYRQAWSAATQRQDRLVAQIDGYLRQDATADTLYLADLPDANPSPTGEHFNILYVFRNSPEAMMRLRYPTRLKHITAVSTRTDVFSVNPLVSPDQLSRWKQQSHTLVLQYDPATDGVVVWNP